MLVAGQYPPVLPHGIDMEQLQAYSYPALSSFGPLEFPAGAASQAPFAGFAGDWFDANLATVVNSLQKRCSIGTLALVQVSPTPTTLSNAAALGGRLPDDQLPVCKGSPRNTFPVGTLLKDYEFALGCLRPCFLARVNCETGHWPAVVLLQLQQQPFLSCLFCNQTFLLLHTEITMYLGS
jgi:hypothetical protein